jgi:hypothetical protein
MKLASNLAPFKKEILFETADKKDN